jgi:putative flavoprotein involved in K+ transport
MGGITHFRTPVRLGDCPEARPTHRAHLLGMQMNMPEGFVEEGTAVLEPTRATPGASEDTARDGETFDVVVIGGGQAGLSVGWHLKRRGLRFVILESGARVGDSWRQRWDSLRLFTPAQLDGLDGMRFPAAAGHFPTKDEMADYLEAYARRFALPLRTGVRVDDLSRTDGQFMVRAGGREIRSDQIVVAMANYQRPKVPAFASELSPEVRQLHSAQYRNATQLRDGDVLLVGAGNSGSEIALGLARDRHVFMSGRDTGHIPFRIGSFLGRHVLCRVVLKGLFHRVLTVRTPLGRKVRPRIISRGGPLIRVMPQDLAAAGVVRVPRTVGVREGRPLLEDGRVLDVANVVWCTGFHPGFSWIRLPIWDEAGRVRHESGVAEGVPGLYFVGLHFLHALSSAMIHGVGRDAGRIAGLVAARAQAGRIEEPLKSVMRGATPRATRSPVPRT